MNQVTTWLNNRYVITILALVTATYAGFAAPAPSPAFRHVLTSDWFRFLIVFLIAYLPKKNFQLSLMIAVGFAITYAVLLQANLLEGFTNGDFDD